MPSELNPPLARRIVFTLGALCLVAAGSFIPIPGLAPDKMAEVARIPAFAHVTAEGISRFSIFALALRPYFLTWTLIQLALTLAPPARRWALMSENRGRLAFGALAANLIVAAIGGLLIARDVSVHGFAAEPGAAFMLTAAATLAGGAMLSVHIAGRIGARGVGDGFLLILAVPLAERIIPTAAGIVEALRSSQISGKMAATLALAPAAGLALLTFAAAPSRFRRADLASALARIDIWPIVLADLLTDAVDLLPLPFLQNPDASRLAHWSVDIPLQCICLVGGLLAFTALRNVGERDSNRRRARWTFAAAQAVLAVIFVVYDVVADPPFLLTAQTLVILLAASGTVLRDIREARA